MGTFILTEKDYELIREFRHDLHRHPELSGMEYRTSEKITKFLESVPGWTILDLPAATGVAARMPGTGPGEIMLRADIDALPQTEDTDIPWKSQVEGVAHACGHDVHTASLCGAALILSRLSKNGEQLPSVDLVFQPAEEGTTGARSLINAGLFDQIHPEVCFGIHNWPSVDTGLAVCRAGALMSAKRNFDIVLYGKGGHGSMPHLNRDPAVCAAAVILSLQTVVSRNINPLDSVILSINRIEGGSPVNRVIDKIRMMGTVRSLSDEALDRAIERVETIVHKTSEAYECEADLFWQERIPVVWNPADLAAAAKRIAENAGCRVTDAPPSLASEDFALYRQYVPSYFFWLGSRTVGTETKELHTPGFFAEDRTLIYGSQLYAACAGFLKEATWRKM